MTKNDLVVEDVYLVKISHMTSYRLDNLNTDYFFKLEDLDIRIYCPKETIGMLTKAKGDSIAVKIKAIYVREHQHVNGRLPIKKPHISSMLTDAVLTPEEKSRASVVFVFEDDTLLFSLSLNHFRTCTKKRLSGALTL